MEPATSASVAPPRPEGLDLGLADYRPPPGVPDELMRPDGRLLPLWGPLLRHLRRFSPEGMARALTRARERFFAAGSASAWSKAAVRQREERNTALLERVRGR